MHGGELDRSREDREEVVEYVRTELEVMKAILDRMETSLFGNGQPGLIASITGRVAVLEKRWWILMGVLAAFQFLTGSGVISLKALITK